MTQVAETLVFQTGDRSITLSGGNVARAWLDHLIASPTSTALPQPLTLGDLRPGEFYAGLILGKDGEPGYHLILLPGEVEDKTWEQAKEWAASVGGELPTRREQSLLYANLGEEFKSAWYWSGTQSESFSGNAWHQDFGDGYQSDLRKFNEFRARAVRRLPL